MTQPPNSRSTNLPISQAINPYVGPRTFAYEQRHLFFGREREARDLLARVLSERLLLFYAQSGAGKSSLLHTRLIPQLQAEKGFVVLPVGRVSGELPVGVGQVDNIFIYNLLLSMDEGADPARLAHVTLGDFLARLTRQAIADKTGRQRKGWVYDPAAIPVPPTPGARRYALIVDQFEEIITSHPARWREREEFFRQLDAAMQADPNLWVVLTLREDYVAALDPYAHLMADRLRARFYMERLGVAAGLDAIREPAALGGRPFAPGIAEKLVEDLRQVRVPGQRATVAGQYIEPVQLQVVCYQLWERIQGAGVRSRESSGGGQEPAGRFITEAELAEAGNVDRALRQFYEETLAAALADPAAAGVSERQLRAWFDEELLTEAGTRGLVRQGEQMTGSLPTAVVRALQRRFLVRGEARGGDTWIELVHDRFVEPIRRSNRAWFDRNLNPLTLDAQAWLDAGKPASQLYGGSQLAAAVAQIAASPADFGELERAFVTAGQQAEARRVGHRQRTIAWGAVALALVFIALAGWALWSRAQIQVEARRAAAAEARALAQKETAEAASTEAAVALVTAQAANMAQVRAMNELEAALQANLTVLAMAAAPPAPTATPTPPPTRPTLTPSPLSPGVTPRPALTVVRTSTPAPSPTANLQVFAQQTATMAAYQQRQIIAQQTQLAQVRVTQTALAVVCRLTTGATFARAWDRSRIGCPTAAEAGVTTAYEAFERGWMLWRKDNDKIYVFFDGGEYRVYTLPAEARPEFACKDAESLGNPRLGFGKVWCENPDVRQRIGKPLAAEIGGDRPLQEFEKGFMIYAKERDKVINVYSVGQWSQ
jgi:hypothetical protein